MATGGIGENFNPAYETFRRHFADLRTVIQDPEDLAWDLYAENIIPQAVRDAAAYVMHEKGARTSNLLAAVESQIKVDSGTFNKFLSVLAKRPSMSDICSRMKDAYAVADQGKEQDASPVPQQKKYPQETHSSQSSSDKQSPPPDEPPLSKRIKQENEAPPPNSSLSGPPHLLNHDDLGFLMNHLQPMASHWKAFGLQLGLLPGELDNVEATLLLIQGGPPAFLQEVLSRWLNRAPPFPTLTKLCDALRSRAVDRSRIALELEQQYQTRRTASTPVRVDPLESSGSSSMGSSERQQGRGRGRGRGRGKADTPGKERTVKPGLWSEGTCEEIVKDPGETEAHNQGPGETVQPHNQDQGETVRPHNQDQGETESHNQDQGETEAHNQDPGETKPHNQDPGETKPHIRAMWVFALIALVLIAVVLIAIGYNQYHAPYAQYVDKVKQRYKIHLHDVAQSFWLPADMHTFIQLSLTSRDKPCAPKVDQDSANQRIVSERSMSFYDLLSEIDASPGSRILVAGQPGIGKTTLLQMITRSWAQDRALSSCWILLHIVLRDLVLLQHAPNLTIFLSLMGSMNLPPDIESFVLESDGKGVCFIADGLDEYPLGYEDKTNFILSELIGAQKPNIKLSQSTVVISSRPEVASQVRHLFDKSVKVLGFGDDQINDYIQEKYGEDKSFSRYLDDHLHIKHTCYIPLHLAMLVYLKDHLLGDKTDLPETETEIYEQFILHTLIRDFCKAPTSSCSYKDTLPTSLNTINESLEVGILLFHIANLSYIGIQKEQSIFTKVEPVLQHTNSSLLVVDKMSVLHPTTYSFPHLTIQEFLAAFYFNTYLSQQEQKRVLVEYSDSKWQRRYVFLKFCCGLKRNENQTTFLEFFNRLYQYNNESKLPYHCAHEAQSLIASQQLINFKEGIAELDFFSYYDAASLAFVAVSATQNLLELKIRSYNIFSRFFLHKLCDAHTVYYQLRKVHLYTFEPSNFGCLLQKSPKLESLHVSGWLWNWDELHSKDAAALVLPPYGTKFLNIRHIHLDNLNIGDKGVKKLSQLLQDSMFLQTLSLIHNGITDNGTSAIADLMKALPRLRHVYLGRNHIGGRGATLLWNQSIHKCCNLSLDYNVIDNKRPDVFISALSSTVNNGYEWNKSCQLEVSVIGNEFLCSDLRKIFKISQQLPKGVMLITGSKCVEMTERIKRFEYYLGENHIPIKAEFQWTPVVVVCTLHIFCFIINLFN